MQVHLVISEPDRVFYPHWVELLQDLPEAMVLAIDDVALAAWPEVQALFLHHQIFHECFGGRPTPEAGQIRSTSGWPFECFHALPPKLPPWVVTSEPLATTTSVLVPGGATYAVLAHAFAAIDDFNNTGRQPPITGLGLWGSSIRLGVPDPQPELDAVRRVLIDRHG